MVTGMLTQANVHEPFDSFFFIGDLLYTDKASIRWTKLVI